MGMILSGEVSDAAFFHLREEWILSACAVPSWNDEGCLFSACYSAIGSSRICDQKSGLPMLTLSQRIRGPQMRSFSQHSFDRFRI